MTDVNDSMNPLSDEELKERMSFKKMFERQEKQIRETPHIQNLLSPSSENTSGPSDLKSRLEHLEDHYNMNTIEQRFLQLETNLKSEINKIQPQRKIKLDIQIKNKRHAYFILGAFASSALLFGLISRPKTKIEYKDKIIYQEKKTKPVTKYYMTKYVNIRTHASTTAEKITTLAPNSLIEIIQIQKDWKKIKYKNHISGKSVIGWAYGENLAPVKN